MSDLLETYRGTVYPWHCDHMGHMNVQWYVGKFDEATWQLLGLLGLTRARFAEEGFGMAAVDQRVQYRRELHAGDLLAIRSTVLRVSEKSITFTHEMTDDATGEVAASTTLVGVSLDTATRRARALPSDVRERAAAMIAELEVGAERR
jgi:acyl-CoA thioester hydrolase